MPTADEILQSGTMTGHIVRASYMEYQAGDNIQINGNVISATDTTYTAGENVDISQQNVISAVDTVYQAGQDITITGTTINSNPTLATNLDIAELFH
jgi:SUMO ligase MMS21 Smc5/6 complex component